MVISSVNDVPTKLEDTLNIMESDPWLKKELKGLETNAGGTLTRFKRRQFREFVARIETEAQSEHESWVNNYYSYSGVPTNPRALIYDNNAAVSAVIAVSGAVVIAGGVTFGGDVTLGGGFAFGGDVVESGFAYQPGFRVVAYIETQRGLPLALEQRLKEFVQLQEGWDSYSGRPISRGAIEQAKTIILKALSEEIRLPKPFVSPTSVGGVGLEWTLESGKELLLEISPTGDLSYLLVTPRPDGGETEIEDALDGPAEVDKIFRSLNE